jgi:predicted Zn-dependent peptidase
MKEIRELQNGLKILYKQSPNTPRTTFCLNFSLNQEEKIAGLNAVMTRLFLQGTQSRSAEQLAQELDEYAIELICELKSDYLSFKFICLNEDFNKALELLSDVVYNTTFDDWEKEIFKYEGEIQVSLDSPRNKALEAFYKNIYENHPYGNTDTIVLENLNKITKEEAKELLAKCDLPINLKEYYRNTLNVVMAKPKRGMRAKAIIVDEVMSVEVKEEVQEELNGVVTIE